MSGLISKEEHQLFITHDELVPLDKANNNSCGAIATYNTLVSLGENWELQLS